MKWIEYTENLHGLLNQLVFSDKSGREIPCDEAFNTLCDLTLKVKEDNKTIYAAGNGASASIASHFAADLAKNGHLHTQVFSDLALITAVSNDLGYDQVFAEPLRRRGRTGDMLVLISSSGNSENLLNAADTAEKLGVDIVTISAMKADNKLSRCGILNAYAPAMSYGNAESIHAAILHYWIDFIVK